MAAGSPAISGLWLLSLLAAAVQAAASASFACGACMLVVAELESGIRAVDPKKVVDSGSFRVNGKGDQVGLHKVPFARSNGHIVELLESVCDNTKEYKKVLNKATGKQVYINKKRTYAEGDESAGMRSKLHGACNDFVDEHDDLLQTFFTKEREAPERELCHEQLGVCTSVDVSPLPSEEPPKDEEKLPHIDDLDHNEEL